MKMAQTFIARLHPTTDRKSLLKKFGGDYRDTGTDNPSIHSAYSEDAPLCAI